MKPPQRNRTSKGLKAACLAASLCVAAWGSAAPADANTYQPPTYEISGQVTPNQDLQDVYVIVGYMLNGSSETAWVRNIGNVSGGNTSNFSFPVNNQAYDGPPNSYTVLGLYDVTNQLVTVALNDPKSAFGQPFENVFSGITEAALANMLSAGDTSGLTDFFTGYRGLFSDLGNDTYLVNFSNGSNGGTATANYSTVPLPPSLVLVLPGLGALLLLRRRRKSAET